MLARAAERENQPEPASQETLLVAKVAAFQSKNAGKCFKA